MDLSALFRNAVSASSESFSLPNYKNKSLVKSLFILLLVCGLIFTTLSLTADVAEAGSIHTEWLPYFLLGLALLIALGFEFVNGFHDTANAVATVIYTHSLPPYIAVLWSGCFNFLGVLLSSGTIAFGIISLLPAELILNVDTSSGFAMIFALLIAAIVWNVGTWWAGLPVSSSHTMIGSILGVGIANAIMHGHYETNGVDWGQAINIGYALLLSPLIGFICAALLLVTMRTFIKSQELYSEPLNNAPPPWWIRWCLILTCTGVSFAHGSNDGQKGMGLIMLILVGSVPMAYTLNRAMPAEHVAQFVNIAQITQLSLEEYTNPVLMPIAEARDILVTYIHTEELTPEVVTALSTLTGSIGEQVKQSGSLANFSIDKMTSVRNDMYLAAEVMRFLDNNPLIDFDEETKMNLAAFKQQIDDATKFIPIWVKVAVAIALGLGTMVGWKRVVVTVGEKIGKSHLTYAQGASAELVTILTIGAAGAFGLPTSTTHVLSSGVAGTMVATWLLTLPMAILISGLLYWLFSYLF
ncbi:MAG: phosphate transporter [Solimicrobium sp.]|nr:phosphate transporter [Solimicrobium sp.]